MNGNGRAAFAYTNKDYASLRAAMLDLARERLPEWTDHSPNDLGVVLVELFAGMGDLLLHYIDRTAGESFLETALERRSVIHLLRLIGYELRPSVPATADLTLLFAAGETGSITIPRGATFATDPKDTGKAIRFQYVREDLTRQLEDLPLAPAGEGAFRMFANLPVVQVDVDVAGEVIGSSDASGGQRFRLARAPLIDGSLVVRVDEGSGAVAWERRTSLLESRPGDLHYVVRRDENDTAWVEFGDGKYGRIPARGHNNIAAAYRTGGGAKGNVPPRTITKDVTTITHLEGVFNPESAAGGADPEPLAEAAVRGPQQFRSMGRAVTASDYEAHAAAFGVGKARARPAGWNLVELFVAPKGGGYPSLTLKEDLRSYFETRRMMTSILEIRDPVYVPVEVRGELEVEARYYVDQVRQHVEEAVLGLLAFERVRFAERLYLSKVYEAIEAIPGVAGVIIKRFAYARDTSALNLPEDGVLRFEWEEIPVAGHARGIDLTRITGGLLG